MFILKFRKKIIFVIFAFFFLFKTVVASEYSEIINKIFEDRKLDTIEGIWIKVKANQGSTGCVTMFFKVKKNLYNQTHIDSCFVIKKVTGRQIRVSNDLYEGENAVYFFDGKVNWGTSKVKITEDNNFIYLTHISSTNTFTEKWKRVWPEDIVAYNQFIEKKNNKK